LSDGLDAIRDSRIAFQGWLSGHFLITFDIPKIPFDQFAARSIDNAQNATENQGYRDRLLVSIRDRFRTAAVKGQALDLCQELSVADGARSDEEDAVLQNLKQLLE
jgi:hypothetical protein